MRRILFALPLVVAGCSKDPGGNPFDAAASATSPVAMEDDEDEDEDAESSGESSTGDDPAESSSSSGAGSSSGEAESSSGAPDPLTTGVDPTAGDGGQPATGQYSHCLDPAECMGVNLCVQIQQDMMVVDGFCSVYPCANAAADCDAAPGGTATPICFPMNIGGMDTAACALDCAAGQTCPTGMECRAVGGGNLCT